MMSWPYTWSGLGSSRFLYSENLVEPEKLHLKLYDVAAGFNEFVHQAGGGGGTDPIPF